MNGYKEFEGRNLDEAIRDACAFFDTSREKLEIEILNDSKGGIFGLVGAKKARIRARMVQLSSVLEGLDSQARGRQHTKKKGESPSPARRERPENGRKQPEASAQPVVDNMAYFGQDSVAELFARNSASRPRPPQKERVDPQWRRDRKENDTPKPAGDLAGSAEIDADLEAFTLERVPFDQLDQAALEAAAREIIARLTEPILGPVETGIAIGPDRIKITLSGVEDAGLLIGRDGQTLASLQYLVTRMLSNRMKSLLRVQIDAGDYRERQDERLRALAQNLAEKAKAGGRPQMTRPLGAYHRRIIHLALQDDPLIQTHSKGEGELKRVMVTRRK